MAPTERNEMKVLAHVDRGTGKVYRVPCPTWTAARAMVRGPYLRDARIVLVEGAKVECYERGTGSLRARLVQA
jgi:hypothetical protein